MVQIPNLDSHDRPKPSGLILPDAFCIQWLNDILDFYYHLKPFSTTVTKRQLNIPANTQDITLPDDFILDVRNGYVVQTTEQPNSLERLYRVPLQKWINRDLRYQQLTPQANQCPDYYMIMSGVLKITPVAGVDKNAWLWMYALPPQLTAGAKPQVPNDYMLIEYIRIRALEWIGSFEPGTAVKFCEKVVGSLQSNGLLNEAEDDEIPLDTLVYRKPGVYNGSSMAWMGAR